MSNEETKREIVFDEKSGISVEEQREILHQIDSIAEKNRQKLSAGAIAQGVASQVKKIKLPAKKKGFLFPLVINAGAVVLLCVGIFIVVTLNSNVNAQVRTGNAVFSITERALIDQIRRETAEQLAFKELEIDAIAVRIQEVDDELMQLLTYNITLTEEQITARERLLAMQEFFRQELDALNEERSNILENSRAREASLRAQLEERSREFAAAQQRAEVERDSAMIELDRLTSEQDRLTAIDAHLAGGIASVSAFLQNGRFDQAEQLIVHLQDFLNAQTIPSRIFQTRREYYAQTLSLMQTMINEMRISAGAANIADHVDRLTAIEELQGRITSMQVTIDAFGASGSEQVQRISELQGRVDTLTDETNIAHQTLAQKELDIETLRTENAGLTQERATLASEVATLRTQLMSMLTELQQALE